MKHMIFISRGAGAKRKASMELIEELERTGVTVTVFTCDISNGTQLKEVLRTAKQTLPPIKGIIQGAMVLKVCALLIN